MFQVIKMKPYKYGKISQIYDSRSHEVSPIHIGLGKNIFFKCFKKVKKGKINCQKMPITNKTSGGNIVSSGDWHCPAHYFFGYFNIPDSLLNPLNC